MGLLVQGELEMTHTGAWVYPIFDRERYCHGGQWRWRNQRGSGEIYTIPLLSQHQCGTKLGESRCVLMHPGAYSPCLESGFMLPVRTLHQVLAWSTLLVACHHWMRCCLVASHHHFEVRWRLNRSASSIVQLLNCSKLCSLPI
jgi:hypothetical protein